MNDRQSVTAERGVVRTEMGSLDALIHVPDCPGPLPGIVLVDGSGDGTADGWGDLPFHLASMGVIVLTHDKPGCGESPGHWSKQSFHDRAAESLSAIAVLRARRDVGPNVGLYGVSQGGWVAVLAANIMPDEVAFIVSVSGPGVSPAKQERARIERQLRSDGYAEETIGEAMAWIDERTRRLVGGEEANLVLETQNSLTDKVWYTLATEYFDSTEMLGFLARILAFDPVPYLEGIQCPVFAAFGAADDLIPVGESAAIFAKHLATLPGYPHALAVFPHADHGLFVAPAREGIERSQQLASGFLTMVRQLVDEHR